MSHSAGISHTIWMSRSACWRANPELFFPVATSGVAAREQAKEAKALCAGCPVRAECLAYAVRTRQKYGVWGGATEEERRAMTRRNRGTDSRVSRRQWHA